MLYLPILLSGVFATAVYGPGVYWLRTLLAPTYRELLKDDVAQFTQNAFAVMGLLFALLLGTTFGFYLQRQERLYAAIYQEVSEARSLLEQLTLLGSLAERQRELLEYLDAYLLEDLMQVGTPKVLGSDPNGIPEPLERLLFATSVGVPSSILGSVLAIRRARSARLAATQRKFPTGHIVLLGLWTFLVLASFPYLSSGMIGFEEPPGGTAPAGIGLLPGHLISLHSVLFGLLVSAVVLASVATWELSDPSRGVFSVEATLTESLRGLRAELQGRRDQLGVAQADPVKNAF